MASATDDEERREEISIYFLLFSGLLAFVIILSRLLHDYPRINSVFSEAALVLVIGMIASFFVHLFLANIYDDQVTDEEDAEDVQEGAYNIASNLLTFSPNIFFMALLPPILFNSGYQLRRELFYRHITPIVMFACLGTAISAVCTGFALYGISLLGWMGDTFSPTLLELLTFGSLIAATDTVSVLAVFQAKRVDPHLFYLCFGESALNDAVAIVLFNTFADFILSDYQGAGSITKRSALFLADMFLEGVGSPALGIISGFLAALTFKRIDFRHHQILELPLYLVLLLYVPFIVAECLHLSGIVAIFFSGISARRYVSPNVSVETVKSSETIFKVAAYVAETCIFLELGLSVFGLSGSFEWKFIGWAFVASLSGRALGIYPVAWLYNLSLKELNEDGSFDDQSTASATTFGSTESNNNNKSSPGRKKRKKRKTPMKRKDKQIPANFMHIIWFAGLRGAVAYACVREFPDLYGHNDEFIAATVVIVAVSIIVMGGATEHLLRYLEIEMGVNEDDYMEDWHKQRQLKGTFHDLGKMLRPACFSEIWVFKNLTPCLFLNTPEYKYIYSVVVREASSIEFDTGGDREDKSGIELEKAFGYQAPPTNANEQQVISTA